MKAIVCEMCSSHDVVKDGEYYVCQNCGTKYTVENAKKLMVEVEGKVDVTGSTVKVDNTDSLANLRELAVRARAAGDIEKAAKYYEMIRMQDPSDWEADFYSVYYEAAGCKIGEISSAADRVAKVIPIVMRRIKENVPEAEQKKAYLAIANDSGDLRNALKKAAQNHYSQFSSVSGSYGELIGRRSACEELLYVTAQSIRELFGDKDNALKLFRACYESGDSKHEFDLKRIIAELDPNAAREISAKEAKSEAKTGITMLIVGALIVAVWFIATRSLRGMSTALDIILYAILVLAALFGILGLVKMISSKRREKKLKK